MFEIHARELRATFLRNHNTGRYKGIAKYPKQKITQAHKTPRPPRAESRHNDTTGNGLNTPKPGT